MGASSSAVLILFALVFAGPLFYFGRYLYRLRFGEAAPNKSCEGRDDVPLAQSQLKKAKSGESDDTKEDDDEEVSHASYMLGLLGYAVGIGNVWRFPYLVGSYGGGAFVFAYIVCLFLIAMPLYFVELGLGQYTRVGNIETMNSK